MKYLFSSKRGKRVGNKSAEIATRYLTFVGCANFAKEKSNRLTQQKRKNNMTASCSITTTATRRRNNETRSTTSTAGKKEKRKAAGDNLPQSAQNDDI